MIQPIFDGLICRAKTRVAIGASTNILPSEALEEALYSVPLKRRRAFNIERKYNRHK
jgi:hypothetical protein